MKTQYIFIFLILLSSVLLMGQGSVSTTYTFGDIPTGYNNGDWDPQCNGPSTTLSVILPPGQSYEVTGIDIAYDMVAAGNLWMSGQNSQIYCQNTGLLETSTAEGTGNMAGTESYLRNNVEIANDIYPGGTTLTFEMRAWRDYTTGVPGCTTQTGKVADNTWTITVHYGPEITPPRVGINNVDPKATLDVGGEIIIGDDGNSPEPGMIKWDDQNQDFMGYDGSEWKSLTQKKTQDIFIPGVAFYPKTANNDYSYLETNLGSGIFHYIGRSSSHSLIYPISLPAGSTINSVTFYYLDSYTNVDISVGLYRNHYNSNTENLILGQSSSGNQSFIRSITINPNYPVLENYFFYLEASNTQTVNTKFLGIKGARINYTLP